MAGMETRELVLTNRDGKRMPATLQLPEGEAKGIALILHGIGGWRNQPVLVAVADEMVRQGYIAFRFDESDGVNSPDNDFFHNTTTHYCRDLEDVLAYVRQQEWYEGPLLLVGHSMGGFVAAWYAHQKPEEINQLILLAPAISLRNLWFAQLPFSLMWLIRGHQKMLGVDGKRFMLGPNWLRDFWKYDALRFAPEIPAPTLIISAGKDNTAAKPIAHRHYTRRFPRAEHSTISWADHDFTGHEDEVVATIRQWHTSS